MGQSCKEQIRNKALKALSNPFDPDLQVKLRFIAASITGSKSKDLQLWLQGDLLSRLLHILRVLPTLCLSLDDATDVCTAAAAVLANICYVACQQRHNAAFLPGSITLNSLAEQVGAVDILAPIIQYGMLSPTSMEPLPPGRKVHMEEASDNFDAAAADAASTESALQTPCSGKQFWTPLRVCGFLLAAVITEATRPGAANGPGSMMDTSRHVLSRLAEAGVYKHLLETALEHPCDMPWIIMNASTTCNMTDAREHLWPNMPLLRQVLERLHQGLDTASYQTQISTATKLRDFSVSFLGPQYDSKAPASASHAAMLELSTLLLELALHLRKAIIPPVEAELEEYWAQEYSLVDSILGGVGEVCLPQMIGAALGAPAARAVLEVLLLKEGLLVRWLQSMHVRQDPSEVLSLLELGVALFTPDHGLAGSDWYQSKGVLAGQFLESLLAECYPALVWAVEQTKCDPAKVARFHNPTPIMNILDGAVSLVDAAIEASRACGAPPKQCVLDGVLQLLHDLHWEIIVCSRPPVAMLGLLQQAAKDGRLNPSTKAARESFQELATQVMIICACGEALAAVAPHLTLLADLEVAKPQGSGKSAVTSIKRSLLAVGEHIERHRWPAWLDCYFDHGTTFGDCKNFQLWHAAASFARLQLNGVQLANMYTAIKQQQPDRSAAPALRPQANGRTSQVSAVCAAAVASNMLLLISHLHPRIWLSSDDTLDFLMLAYRTCPNGTVRQAAEEATLAGLSDLVVSPAAWASGAWATDLPNSNKQPMLLFQRPLALAALQPYTFTQEELWETEPPRMDLWLAGAALCVGGLDPKSKVAGILYGNHDIKSYIVDLLQPQIQGGQGWNWVKAWSLAYTGGGLGRGRDARQARRWGLRLECVKVVLRTMAKCKAGPGHASSSSHMYQQWLEELDKAAKGVLVPGCVASAASKLHAAQQTLSSSSSSNTAAARAAPAVSPSHAATSQGVFQERRLTQHGHALISNVGAVSPGLVLGAGTLTGPRSTGAPPSSVTTWQAGCSPASGAAASRVKGAGRPTAAVGDDRAATRDQGRVPATAWKVLREAAASAMKGLEEAVASDMRGQEAAEAASAYALVVEERPCGQCGGQHEELLVCSGCMRIKYCSAECQRAHWRQHKTGCKQAQQERLQAAA